MSVFHDEVEIEDFEFDEVKNVYHYPCPCGDRFEISLDMLEMGEDVATCPKDVATCPSCSLIIRVIYDLDKFVKMECVSSGLQASTQAV
uniref:DPH-type MB domain-containing protein n=1 Tax=Panagrolaimus sp. JU765 TaxID=591449 RepID=A0AC34R170_9BILA